MNEETKIYQFEDSDGNKVAPLVPEKAVVDKDGVRLDQKLEALNVNTIKEQINTAKEKAIEEVEASLENLTKNVGLDLNYSPTISEYIKYNTESDIYREASLIKGTYVKSIDKWRNLGLGLFMHWGVYSTLGGRYSGLNIEGEHEDYTEKNIPEWILRKARIPIDTYKSYASEFNSSNFNTDEIAKLAYLAGLKYIVITAKHHEGFLLFNDNNASWNISSTNADDNILLKLKKSCDKYNIKFCIYYSQKVDWTAEGGFGQDYITGSDPYSKEQHVDYCNKTIAILKHLVDELNPYVLWYDGGGAFDSSYTEEYAQMFYDAFLKYYPQVIVNDRLFADERADYFTGENKYYRGTEKYAEGCFTANYCWGYSIDRDNAENTISISGLINNYILDCACRGQNCLINIGPKGDGSLPQYCVELLKKLGDFQQKYGTIRDGGDAVYNGCQPNWGRCFRKGNILKCYVQNGESSIKLDGIENAYLSKAISYDNDTLVIDKKDNETTIISGISKRDNDIPTVIDLIFDNDIICYGYNILDDDNLKISASSFNLLDNGNYLVNNYIPNIGGLSSNGNFTTTFKYNGESKTYKVQLSIAGRGAGGKNFNIKSIFTDEDDSSQEVNCTDTQMTSTETISLVKGKLYSIRCEKTGTDWCNFASLTLLPLSMDEKF